MTDQSVPGWRLDEESTAGRENLDADHVRRYDLREDADAAAEVALLARLGLGSDATIVEFGPGTGQFTVEAARHFRSVVAVDVSAVMLDRLRDKLTAEGLGNVEVVEAGFVSYDHPCVPVDCVYSRLAMHHLPDFWKAVALARMRRMLKPGGLVRLWDVVYNFDPGDAEQRIEAWCATAGDATDSQWGRWELEEHVRDEHSTFSWLIEAMFERCGFGVIEASYTDDGIFAKYVLEAG